MRQQHVFKPSAISGAALLLLALALVRLLTLGAYPLFDQTEARYAEIARLMAETGDWIVLHIDYGVPFWAKPPLSTWLSAGSISLFGVSEFAARFPSLILALATVGLTYIAGSGDRLVNSISAVVLASSALFFIAAGAVMTDMSLAFCTTLAMVSFHRAMETKKRLWGYIFFIALGLGMLAKGPIAIVLTGLPTLGWIIWTRRWHNIWSRLPWFRGTALAATIFVPWYIAAEIRSPGFLYYFLFVEHFKRFMASGKIPDLYGHQNIVFYGTIWVYWFLALLPWSAVITVETLGYYWRSGKLTESAFSSEQRYFLCWALAPMFFFTFTRDILWTYVLPALPPSAILIAGIVQNRWKRTLNLRRWPSELVVSALLAPILVVGFAGACSLGFIPPPSGKYLHSQVMKLEDWKPVILGYVRSRPYSAQFYELGKVPFIADTDIANVIRSDQIDFLAIPRNDPPQKEIESKLKLVGGDSHYQLFRINNKH